MLCPHKVGAGSWSRRPFADGRSQIAAIAHEQQCRDRGECVEQPKHATLALVDAVRQRFEQRSFQCDPVRRGVHFVFGELELAVANVLIGEKFYFLEAHDLRADQDVAVRPRIRVSGAFGSFGRPRGFENAHLRVADRVGVVIDVYLLDISFAFFEVEMLDVVLLPAVNVNGFFVKKNQRAREIHFADDVWRPRDIDDDEVVAHDGTEADRVGRIRFVRPVIVISGKMQVTGLNEAGAKIRNVYLAEGFAGCDRQLESGAF